MMSGHNADQRWYWTGNDVRDRPRRRRGARQSCPRSMPRSPRRLRSPRRRSSRRPSARPRRATSRSKAAASRSAPAGSRARPATPTAFRASPELDGDTLALAAGAGRRDAARPRRRPRPARDRPVGDRLCRPHLRHRGRGDVPPAARARPRARRFPGGARQPRDRLCGGADRRSWRQGHSRARAAARASPTRRASIPALDAASDGQGAGRQARPRRARACSAIGAPATSIVDRTCKPRDQHAAARLPRVAAYTAHPQVAAVFTADADRARPRCRPAPPDQLDADPARPRQLLSRRGRAISSCSSRRTSRRSPTRRSYVATHGSPWDYDRRVPILFWRPGMAGTTVERCRSRRPTSCRRWRR